ncbi:GNAT family protein [Bacillus horti]
MLVDRNRVYLRQWLPWVDGITSVKDYDSIMIEWMNQLSSQLGFQTGIRYKNELVGMIGFHPIDWSNRKAAIGYWLAQGFQGRGIMTRACQAMVHYAFQTYHLNRVEIQASIQNVKSRAIPERLGFVFEGYTRDGEFLYDRYVDLVNYGLLKREWERHG